MALNKESKRAIERNALGALRNIILVVLCAGMLGMSMVKLVGEPMLMEKFASWGIGPWLVRAIGLLELAMAICIFIKPTRVKGLMALGALLLAALAMHLFHQDYYGAIGPFAVLNAVLLLLFLERTIKSGSAA